MRICGQDDTVIPEYQVIAASDEVNTEIYDEHTQLLCSEFLSYRQQPITSHHGKENERSQG